MGFWSIKAFSGIAPRFADRLLDNPQASFVTNLRPTNGDLRGFRSLALITRLVGAQVYRKALKLYYPGSETFEWFLSTDVGADALQSPLATDAFNRVYISDKNYANLVVTTLADIHNAVAPTVLGVPRPTVAPVVTATGGSGGTDVRAYVYTYTGAYGSIGAPSPPTIHTGKVDDAWNIAVGLAPTGVTKITVYRSGTGDQSANYYRIGDITPPATSITDTVPVDQLPLQTLMDSEDNDPPPVGLYGLQQHSSGALVAFKGRTVYFSKTYLPHAWPAEFAYTVEGEIVGIACIYNQVMVMTKSFPAVLAGSSPDAIQILNLTDTEPCLAKRSIVIMNNTVYYASPNGLVSISSNGLSRPINPLMTNLEFEPYGTADMVAGTYSSYYICFYNANQGFVVALPPYEPVSFIQLDRFSDVTGLDTDKHSGDLYFVQTNRVSAFDQQHDSRFACTWRSKEFIAPKDVNLGAYQILSKTDKEDENSQQLLINAAVTYNAERISEGPLDLIGSYPIGGSIDTDFSNVDPILGGLPPIQPLGGEPLYNLEGSFSRGVRFTLYADGDVKYSKITSDENAHRLPSGYKATRYYFEISSSIPIQQVTVASTPRELSKS